MKILLTGAAGFIGSNLAKKLLATSYELPAMKYPSEASGTSYELRAFVRYNSRADIGLLSLLPKHELDQIDLVLGDLRDPSAILEAAQGCDLIYHLGALISIPYSYLHPVETVQSNVLGTLNILEAARQLGIPVVHTSTSEVYGTALRVPIDEEHPLQGQSPYSASKIGADKLVEAYYRSFEVPVITVRPFNTYGPGQSARAVIPTIITQALTQDHLNLGSLDTKRDFTYVDDTVSGFLMAGQALMDAMQEIRERQAAKESVTEQVRKRKQELKEQRDKFPIKKPFPTGSLDLESGDPLIKNPAETSPISHPAPFLVDHDPSEVGDKPAEESQFFTHQPQSTRAERAVSALSHQLIGETYNLGTGSEVTIGEITEIILKIIGKPDLPIHQDPERIRPAKSEVMRLLSDNSKAREQLGWQPTVTLEQGLERTIAWISDHLDKYRIGKYER